MTPEDDKRIKDIEAMMRTTCFARYIGDCDQDVQWLTAKLRQKDEEWKRYAIHQLTEMWGNMRRTYMDTLAVFKEGKGD